MGASAACAHETRPKAMAVLVICFLMMCFNFLRDNFVSPPQHENAYSVTQALPTGEL